MNQLAGTMNFGIPKKNAAERLTEPNDYQNKKRELVQQASKMLSPNHVVISKRRKQKVCQQSDSSTKWKKSTRTNE